MSLEIETLRKGVSIISLASLDERYYLEARDDRNNPLGRASYSFREYRELIKTLWENYLDKEEIPKLLDFPLSDSGIIGETLHCIAHDNFYVNNSFFLDEDSESLLYWLKLNQGKVREKIGEKLFEVLDSVLDEILLIQSQRQRTRDSPQFSEHT